MTTTAVASTRRPRSATTTVNTRALEIASGLAEQMRGHEKLDDERISRLTSKLDETANSLSKFVGEVRQQFEQQSAKHDVQHHENVAKLSAISASVSSLVSERTGALGTWSNLRGVITVLLALATFVALLWWHR